MLILERFISTQVLADMSAKLRFKAKEEIHTDLTERREMSAGKPYDGLNKGLGKQPALAGSPKLCGKSPGDFTGGEQLREGVLGMSD